jgi:hypothetical protein
LRKWEPGRTSPSTTGNDSGAASTCAEEVISNIPSGIARIGVGLG